jgi:hypothetical protein
MKSLNMSERDLYHEAQDGIQKALSKLYMASLDESIVSLRRIREMQALNVWGGSHSKQVVSLENVRGQVVNIQASEEVGRLDHLRRRALRIRRDTHGQ